MNSALHGASLSPVNVITMKVPVPALGGTTPTEAFSSFVVSRCKRDMDYSGEGRNPGPKAGIQAPGLFLVLKTTPEKTHVVPVERVPEKTGKWNPGPRYRHMNHAGHRPAGVWIPAFAGMTWGGVNMDTPRVAVPCRQRCTPAARSAAEGYCAATSTKI